MENVTEKDWLVVFFVHEIAEYGSIINNVIREIKHKGCGANVSFYMLFDKVKEEDRVLHFRLSVFKLEKKLVGRGFRFRKQRQVKFDNRSRRCWETGMQYIFQHEKFKRCMLFTLSHGAAFGLNRDIGTVHRPKFRLKKKLDLLKPDRKLFLFSNHKYYFDQWEIENIGRNLRGALTEAEWREISKGRIEKKFHQGMCRNLEILWTADLAAALERLPGKPVIDLLVMANCYMQTFETGYILRDRVKYLVAPESSIAADGYDFPKLLGYLDNASITTGDIAKNIVDDYQVRQANARINLNFSVLSANLLSPYADLFAVFVRIIKAIEAQIPALAADMAAIREKIRYVAFFKDNTHANSLKMIDAVWWMKRLLEKFPDVIGAPELAARIDELLKAIVINQHIGDHFVKIDQAFEVKYGISGVSLFYPTTEDYKELTEFVWCANFDTRVPSPFRRNAEWDQFLKKYYSLTDKPTAS